MARPAVTIPSTFALDWTALPTTDGNVGGVAFKPLSADPATGAATLLLHLPPGWHDPQLDWHPATEESFKLAGWSRSGDRASGTPSYIFRPPGLLHGPTLAEDTLGATFLIRMDGELRIHHVPWDAPGVAQDAAVAPEYAAGRERLVWVPDIEAVERRPAPADGPWAGALVRELRSDPGSGGGLVLLDLPPGWSGEGSRGRGEAEELVLAGALRAGGGSGLGSAGPVELTRWGYACRPAGAPAGRYSTGSGATLACWWTAAELG